MIDCRLYKLPNPKNIKIQEGFIFYHDKDTIRFINATHMIELNCFGITVHKNSDEADFSNDIKLFIY